MSFSYHVISIDNSRKENKDNIHKVMNSSITAKRESIKSFNGVNPEDIAELSKLYPEFNLDKYLETPLYPTRPERRTGEYGCWMSHYHAWRHMIDNNIPEMLILEDDVYIDNRILESIKALGEGTDFMIFGHWAEAVYVSLEGAKKLVEAAMEYGFKLAPVDEYLMLLVRLSGMLNIVCGKYPLTRQLIETYPSNMVG